MNKNIKPDDIVMGAVGEMMRDHCYVPGRDWYKFMEVTLKKGERIGPHKHVYHTVLYYPEAACPVIVTPEPGTILYLPPGTQHEVPAVKKPRISIAMLIEKEKT